MLKMSRRASLLSWRSWLLLFLVAVTVFVTACGGGSSPTSPTPPVTISESAAFRLLGAGYDETVSYGGANLILCTRNAGFADLFVRFAEQRNGNGDSGPRIDLDVCGYEQGGSFVAMDPRAASCGGPRTFDIFWHDDGNVVYSNNLQSSPCQLDLTLSPDGRTLNGQFACAGLVDFNGSAQTLDVLDGSFQCEVE